MAGIRTKLKELELQQWLGHVALRGSGEGEWQPATDVYETEVEFVILVELPGLKREAIQIHFAQNTLTIAGERRREERQKVHYVQMEVSFGRFRREIAFYKPVKPERMHARYADGFLKVVLPKI